MTLREQIEALEPEHDERAPGWYFDGWNEAHQAILDIIDQHRCIPDRDALARALHEAGVGCVRNNSSAMRAPLWCVAHHEQHADRIIAALETP